MSLRLLALDTTSEFGSIALSEGDRVVEEVAIESPDGFGHVLFDEILRLLKRHDLELRDLDGFAAAAGPGSFTGVRVGLTAIKGLAEANERRAVAVSNLQALAYFGSRPLRATVLDARRGEIYGGVYDSSLNLVGEETVIAFDAWLERLATLPRNELEVIACGFDASSSGYPWVQAPRAIAGAVARIAARRFQEGCAQDPAEIEANYVRRSDAELLWRDPRVATPSSKS